MMKLNKMMSIATLLIAPGLVACGNASESAASAAANEANETETEFVSASTVPEIQQQMRRLPKDDIWWTVNGEDMAWNFKNLHQIFPTVNVYRDGSVRTLARRPMKEISEFIVDTPEGSMTFESFIESDQSTTMGVVVLHHGDIV